MRSAPWPVRQRRSQTPIHLAHRALSAETSAPEDRALELARIKPRSDLEAHVAHLSKGQVMHGLTSGADVADAWQISREDLPRHFCSDFAQL